MTILKLVIGCRKLTTLFDKCNPIGKRDSCEIDEEYLENGCYTVTSAYSFVSICQDCLECFNPVVEIDARLSQHLRLSPNGKAQKNISAIHNMYDCRKCNQPIRDGEKLVTVNHCFETREKNTIQPNRTDIAFLMCKPCARASEIEHSLEEIIKTIIPKIRQALIHPLVE
jgi:hypothetical protein